MLKIGALSFINALPFFCPFIEKRVEFDGEFSYGNPLQVNALLEQGKVDVGLISSASFIANRERYILLTNLGIAATQCIKSVCLYSKKEPTKLQGKKIAIPYTSATSVMLLKILCEHVWHVKPEFVEYAPGQSIDQLLQSAEAALIIGDECLLANPGPELIITDLCHAWYGLTKRPFVFAVFATRLDAWMELPEAVREFHQKLFVAYDYSSANFHETLSRARAQTGLAVDTLQNYYKDLDYYLDSAHFQGLEQFAKLRS